MINVPDNQKPLEKRDGLALSVLRLLSSVVTTIGKCFHSSRMRVDTSVLEELYQSKKILSEAAKQSRIDFMGHGTDTLFSLLDILQDGELHHYKGEVQYGNLAYPQYHTDNGSGLFVFESHPGVDKKNAKKIMILKEDIDYIVLPQKFADFLRADCPPIIDCEYVSFVPCTSEDWHKLWNAARPYKQKIISHAELAARISAMPSR